MAELEALRARIHAACEGRPQLRLMEVCGSHTMAIFRAGLRAMIPPNLELLSGPGCPVCVTAQGYIDSAIALALRGVEICTYGDMLRVPGEDGSLALARARGAKVRVVYSARDALLLAKDHPESEFVFLAVGFETTTPGTALAIREAAQLGLRNLRFLIAHKLVIPAMCALLADGSARIDGFICPGHVSVIIGLEAYRPVVAHGAPCVVAGFEAASMLEAIALLCESVASNTRCLQSAYGKMISAHGNAMAKQVTDDVFEVSSCTWRALGKMEQSGLSLRERYHHFDAARHYGVDVDKDAEIPGCRCGEVIQGKVEPTQCPLFAKRCTPSSPIGPCMVSSEGSCAAWFKYADRRESRDNRR